MLVLSRRVGESIVIGDGIVVTVLEFRGDVVRIGVDAPRHIQVHRQELLVEIAESNRAAASPRGDVVAGLSQLVAPRDDSTPDRDADNDTGAGTSAGTDPGAVPGDAERAPDPQGADPAQP
jgi:carbon storage regulator